MLEFYLAHRGPISLLLVFAAACSMLFVTISAIHKQSARVPSTHPAEGPVPQHRLITAVNEAGAIGVGIVWTVLIYTGPSLTQLWLGAGGVSHWIVVLLYTQFWLSLSRVVVPANSADITSAIIVRVIIYGVFILGAFVGLNDW